MLDQYETEWEDKCRAQTAHQREMDQLRNANRHLSQQVKSLEGSLATMNKEHVELVKELVLAKIAKEDMENELVRYKALYAELAHAHAPDVLARLSKNPSEERLSVTLGGGGGGGGGSAAGGGSGYGAGAFGAGPLGSRRGSARLSP